MQVDAQKYLNLVEATDRIGFLDIESSGFKADYNRIFCASVVTYQGSCPRTWMVPKTGNDKTLLVDIKNWIDDSLDIVVTYYGKGFDWPMLNSRRIYHNLPMLRPMHHIDMYYTLRPKLQISSKKLGHVANFLKLNNRKMEVLPSTWAELLSDYDTNMPILKERCESDVLVLRDLYKRLRKLITNVAMFG